MEARGGELFGPFRVLRLIGKGGMGAVYLAERVEGDFSQQVALKLLAPHLVDEKFAERFRAERQVLASLNHPHIVRLLDGGVGAKGEPYLATEYIEGQALDRFANERKRTVRERVRLFLQVCSAVEYAHQNLIVHRDLKPSNVLVANDGTAKLLDFGTAKLTTAVGEKTATEAMLLTPKYASPEQLRNEAITTRSDIYSLGMMLYELLGGARPFDSTGDAIGELARAYHFAEPTALGKKVTGEAAAERRVGARELERELRGDLRAIAAKAIAHEAERRYASVAELARDLEAYLNGRPVGARNPSFWYVAGKLVARQKWAVGAAGLLLVAIGVGVGTTVYEKRRAERRFAQVRQLARYQLFDVYDEAEKIVGSTRLRARLAEEALRYLDGLREEAAGDAELQVELARGYLRVADVMGNYTKDNLGDREKAEALYDRAAALLAGLPGGDASEVRAELDLAQAMGDHAAAAGEARWSERLDSAVTAFEKLKAAKPRSAAAYLALGNAYSSAARARQAPKGLLLIEDRSRELVEKAQAAYEKGLSLEPDNEKLIAAMHRLCGSRAIWTSDLKPEESLRWSSEGERWALQRKNSRETAEYLLTESSRLGARAAAYGALGDKDESARHAKAAVAMVEKLARDEDNLAAQMNLIIALSNWAGAEYELGNKQTNFEICERMLALVDRESAKPRGQSKTMAAFRRKALYDASYAYLDAGRPDSLAIIERAYREFVAAAKEDPNDERPRFYLCDILLNLNTPVYTRPAEAKIYALEMMQAQPDNPNGYDFLAQAELALQNVEGAIEAYRKAMVALAPEKKGAAGAKFQKFYEDKIAELTARLGRTNQ